MKTYLNSKNRTVAQVFSRSDAALLMRVIYSTVFVHKDKGGLFSMVNNLTRITLTRIEYNGELTFSSHGKQRIMSKKGITPVHPHNIDERADVALDAYKILLSIMKEIGVIYPSKYNEFFEELPKLSYKYTVL